MFIVEEKVETTKRQGAAALDPLFAVLAVAALTVTVLLDLPVRASPFAASDLKTLYASAWCFRHGLDAYRFAGLQAVFHAQGVVPPANWFGHAPVYPPTTLALLAPLTFLPMVQAAYLVTLVSAGLFAFAVADLLRYAGLRFDLPPGWRAGVAALCAACPLFAFALTVGNLSVPATALSLLAFLRRERGSPWLPAALLAVAVLLKPHLAIWMLAGMLLLPERRAPAVALRAAGLAAVAGVLAAVTLARGQLIAQIHAFFAVVGSELAPGGSMNVRSREILPVASQITSLRSLLGFWLPDGTTVFVLSAAALFALLAALAWHTRRIRNEQGTCLAVATWCAFGLLTTYHRAHDALLLVILLPWILFRLRERIADWVPWTLLALYGALSCGPAVETIRHLSGGGALSSLPAFLTMRQSGVASLLLFVLLLALLLRTPGRDLTGRSPVRGR